MSELISGKEALIALANAEEVEIRFNSTDGWNKIDQKDAYSFEIFLNPISRAEFRIKPRTITINGVEVPAPFEPKHGEIFWHIDVREICSYNYKQEWSDSDEYLQLGAWRTEEEIRQVIAALRIAFKPQ